MYISSLLEGVSEALGFSWKAFQWTRAWTPVDRSAVSKLRLPTQQKGQTTSLMISTIARLFRAAAIIVVRPRARIVSYWPAVGTRRRGRAHGFYCCESTGLNESSL